MTTQYQIIIFYQYARIADIEGFRLYLKSLANSLDIKGRILIAEEGINGTVEGSTSSIESFTKAIHSQDGSPGTFVNLANLWIKSSPGTGSAFPKLKVKIRNEIVTLGLGKEGDIDPNELTGHHLKPQELKDWIQRGEDFEIIDMRNDYEFKVGHFRNSINPQLENFRDLKTTASDLAHLKNKKVLTVCTYGVRCEKASGYLKSIGFTDVHQLDGGIGTYMKAYPGEDFLGSLYVFDGRITERFTDQYEKVGRCEICQSVSERYGNCQNPNCHKKMIVCDTCEVQSLPFCSNSCEDLYRLETLSIV